VDGVGGDERADLGDVFDQPRMLANGLAHGRAAVRTTLQSVGAMSIDTLWGGTTRPGVAGFSARLLAPPARGRFQVHRRHARGRRGAHRGVLGAGLRSVPLIGFLPQGHNRGLGLAARQIQDRQGLLALHAAAACALSTSRQCRSSG
jgi:hypothetical protein